MSSDLDKLDSVRAAVRDELLELCPNNWEIKAGQVTPGKTVKPTVYLNYHRIEPLPEAPIGQVRVSFEITIATKLVDVAKGEDDVDDLVLDLILALDAHPTILWTNAEKVLVEGTDNLGWKITVSTIATKTKE